MEMSELYLLLSRLFFGAAAVFLAILLWAKSRDAAWMFVILGIFFSYSETVYSTLEEFGLTGSSLPALYGVPVVRMLLINAPIIMFSVALLIMVRRRKPR